MGYQFSFRLEHPLLPVWLLAIAINQDLPGFAAEGILIMNINAKLQQIFIYFYRWFNLPWIITKLRILPGLSWSNPITCMYEIAQ